MLPAAWRLRYVDKPSGSQESWLPRKRKCAAMEEPEAAEPEPMEAMSRLFSWALKYGAFNKYGLVHLAGGWFEVGELLSQDKFENYSIKDVKWLVACSCHKRRGPRFQLREDTVEYHKAYFIRATSDKNIFR